MVNQTQNPFQPPQAQAPLRTSRNSVLSHLRSSQVKKMRNHSHTIKTIGILACIAVVALIGFAFYHQSDTYFIIFNQVIEPKVFFLISSGINLIGALSLLLRQSWGRVVGIIYCALMILNLKLIPILIGILGIIALASSQRLFGKDKITHKEINTEYKHRKKEGRL